MSPARGTGEQPRLKGRATVVVQSLAVLAVALTAGTTVAASEEHGLSQKAVEIARPFGFPITNSMVVTWIVALGLIVFAQIATRNMKQVPTGAQNFLEWLVESLYGFLEGIIGPHLVRRTFWFFATIFIFILAANWVGLVPGVGSIGWGHQTAEGFRLEEPFFRGANADVNLTLAMALDLLRVLDRLGPSRRSARSDSSRSCSRRRARAPARLKVLMIVVFFAAGCLEVVSICSGRSR